MSNKGLSVLLLSLLPSVTYAASRATCAATEADIKSGNHTVKFQCREYLPAYASSANRFVWHDLSMSYNLNSRAFIQPWIAYTKESSGCHAKSEVGDTNNLNGIAHYSSNRLFHGRQKTVCELDPEY